MIATPGIIGAAVNAAAPAAVMLATQHPIPTHTEGWSYGSIGIWLFGTLMSPALILGLVKLIPIMRKLANDREKTIDDERRSDMATMRQEIADLKAEMSLMRASHEREIAIMRHRANNATMCVDALLMLLKAAPEKVADHVATITAMRDTQRMEEAAEKGAGHVAKITAAASPALGTMPAT